MKSIKKLFILLVTLLLSLSTLSPLPTFAQETPQDAGTFYDDVPQARDTLLGAAQYFHIFADRVLGGGDTYGNIAVRHYNGDATIGTKASTTLEYYYLQNFDNINGAAFETNGPKKVVFGNNVDLDITNFNRPIANGRALDRVTSSDIYQDKSGLQYIDFDAEFSRLKSVSQEILNTEVDDTYSNSDFSDRNNRIIDISKYEGPIVHIRLTEDVLKMNTPLYIKNLKTTFDDDYKFVYISVDTGDVTNYTTLSQIKLNYSNNGSRDPHESTDFSDSSLLWTFGSSNSPFNGTLKIKAPWQGSILSPSASLESEPNIDGSIIVKEFSGQGETHRWDPQNRYGGVKLIKVDGDDSSYFLEGAEFSLYDSNNQLIKSGLKTNNEGILLVTNLEFGDYYFVETKAPEGYEISDIKHRFTVKSDTVLATVSLTVENQKEEVPEKPKGSVELTKIDAKDASLRLKDAIFALYDNEDNLLSSNLSTDENGKLVISDLEHGNYYLRETHAPEGYELSDTKYEFTINKDSVTEPVLIDAKNTKTEEPVKPKGSVELTKVDSQDSSIRLKDAEFSLYDQDNNLIFDKLTTDSNGKLIVSDLTFGSYYLIETKAPDGYVLSDEKYEFTIDKETVVTPITIEATNAKTEKPEQPKGSMQIIKHDSLDESKYLSGAEFTLYNSDNIALIQKIKTNVLGKVTINDLEFGDYYLIETKAPDGYELSTKRYDFNIGLSNIVIPVDIKIENTKSEEPQPRVGSMILTKTDAKDASKYLANAKFALYKENGELVSSDHITNQNGKIRIDNLAFGKYYLKETKAPDGYEISDKKISFTIDESVVEKALNLKFTNKKIVPEEPKGSVQLTKVDDSNASIRLQDAVFTLYDKDDNIIYSELTTDENGLLIITDLVFGKYYLKETKAPIGYDISDTKYVFTINEDSVKTPILIEAKNSKTEKPEEPKGSVQLTKVDDTNASIRLKDAFFTLYDNDDNILISDLITDEDGTLTITDLELGNYYLKETQAPVGYELSSQKYEFTIIKNNILTPIQIEAKNKKIDEPVKKYGSVELLKVDANEPSLHLENAIFALYHESGTLVSENLHTNKQGILNVADLEFGNYYFIETQAPNGYQLSDEKYEFTIDKLSVMVPTHIKVENYKEDIPNNPVGSVKIIKTDKQDSSIVLKEAQFSLYTEDGMLVMNNLKTDDHGEIDVQNLAYGNYYFIETSAPKGYQISNQKYDFTISDSATNQDIILNITNEKIVEPITQTGKIRITKKDKDNPSIYLENTGFSVYRIDGTLIHDNLFTNKEGYVDVVGLDYGDYYFIESKAPEGYSINPEKIYFSITEENISTLNSFDFYDKKIVEKTPSKPLPNTGVANNNIPLFIGIVLISIPTCGWLVLKKKGN